MTNATTRSFMTMTYPFKGSRIIDDLMIPCDWTMSFNLKAKHDITEGVSPDRIIDRLHYWLESTLEHILMVNVADECALDVADLLTGNQSLYTPSLPTDDLLVRILHAKLSALTAAAFTVDSLTLTASDSNTSYTFAPATGAEYDLPKTVGEYTGSKGMEDVAWWFRNDGWTFEFLIPDDDEFDPKEWFSELSDPLCVFDEIYDAMMESLTADDEVEAEPTLDTETSDDGKIIKVDIWKTQSDPKKDE